MGRRGRAAPDDKIEHGEQKTVKVSSSDNAIPKPTPLQQSTPTYDINQRPRRQIKHKYITDRRPTIAELVRPNQTTIGKDVNLISATPGTPVLPLEPQSEVPVKRKRGRPRTIRPVSIDELHLNSNDSSMNHAESTDNTEHSNSSDNILQLVEIINDSENGNTVELSADDSSSKPYELLHVVYSSSQSQDLINSKNVDDHPVRSVSPPSLDGITIERHSDDTYLVTVDSGNVENSNKIYVENSSLYSFDDVYGFEEQQAVAKICEPQPKSFEGAFSGIRKSKRLTCVRVENDPIDQETLTNKKAYTEDCKIIDMPEMTATDAVSLAVLQLNQLESSMSTDSSKNKKSKKIQSTTRSKRITRYNLPPNSTDTQTSVIATKSPVIRSETTVMSETLPETTLIITKDSQLNATPVSDTTNTLVELINPESIPERSLTNVDKLKITPPRSSVKLQAQISTTLDILLKKSRPDNGAPTAVSNTMSSSKVNLNVEKSVMSGSHLPSVENREKLTKNSVSTPPSPVRSKKTSKSSEEPISIPPKLNPSLEKPDICGTPLPLLENRDDKVAKISGFRPPSPVKLKKTPKRSDDLLNISSKLNLSIENKDSTSSIIVLPSPSVDNGDKIEKIPIFRSLSPVKLKASKRSDESLSIKTSKIDFSEALDKLEMNDRQSISWKRRNDGERGISVKKSKTKSRTQNNLEGDNTLQPDDRNQMPVITSKLSTSKNADRKRNKASHIEKALLESGSHDPIETQNSSVNSLCESETSSQKSTIPIVSDAQINLNMQSNASINSELPVINSKQSNEKDAELALNLLKQLQEPVIPKPVVKTKGSLKLLVDPKISIDQTVKDKKKRKHANIESSSKKASRVKSKKIKSHAATESAEFSKIINVTVDETSPSQLPEVNVRKNAKLKSTRWGKIDTATEPDKLSLNNFNNGHKLSDVEQVNCSIVQQAESSFLNYTTTSENELVVKPFQVISDYESSAGIFLTNGGNHEYNDVKEDEYDDLQMNEFIVNSISPPMVLEAKSSPPYEEGSNIRRSGRIKIISETKQRSHGYGLVKDKERFQNMMPSDLASANLQDYQYSYSDGNSLNSTLDAGDCDKNSHRNFFAAIDPRFRSKEEMEKDERDVQEGLALFGQIVENDFKTERNICREAKDMVCDCFLTAKEIFRGEYGCGEDCMNRMLMVECSSRCNVGLRCTNNRFQNVLNASCTIFKTDKKGFGMKAVNFIPAGEFIMEYVGEVLNSQMFEQRANEYSLENNKHHYFMALRGDRVIDATLRGNISRFINHSCDPNAETQKWTVNGELRIGFFSIKNIYPNEEITFDYQFQRYGKEAQKCYCEAENCRGWIGEEPETDEECEEFDYEEEEEADETNMKPTIPDINSPEQLAAATFVESTNAHGIVATSNTSIDPILPLADSVLPGNDTEIVDLEIPAKAAQKPKKPKVTKAVENKDKGFKKHIKTKRAEIMEDPDLDMEIDTLTHSNLKNQAQTLRFSRLMVRAKLKRARSQLLSILRNGELACRRLFLDYHGLKLLYNWMCDEAVENDQMAELQFRLEILVTLEVLPIPNKLMLQDSKVLLGVQEWATSPSASAVVISAKTSPIDTSLDCDKFNEVTNDKLSNAQYHEALRNIPELIEQDIDLTALKQIITTNENNEKKINNTPPVETATSDDSAIDEPIAKLMRQIRSLALKLVTAWNSLPEAFRIPKKLRIEQMKEHEREANLNCSALGLSDEMEKQNQQQSYKDRYRKDGSTVKDHDKDRLRAERPNRQRSENEFSFSKLHRRQMFEAKVAEEKRRSEQERMHVFICSYFQLDPRLVHERDVPFYVDPFTGQWYARDGHKVATPPSHMHVKPPGRTCSTNLNDYSLPPMDLPEFWKCAITEQGHLYYYHVKIRIPQWQPPIKLLPLSEATNATRRKPDVAYLRNKSASDREDEAESSDADDCSVYTLHAQLANMYNELNDKKNNPYYVLKAPPNLAEEISEMANASTSRTSSLDVIKPLDLSATLEGAQQLIPDKYMAKRIGLADVRMMSPRTDKERMEMKDEMRRNKEKVRRRKEEARRKKHALVPSVSSLEPSRKLTKLTEGLPMITLDEDSEVLTTANDSLTTMTAMLDEEIAQFVEDDASFSINPVHGSIIMKNVDELDILRNSKSLLKTLSIANPVPVAESSLQIQKRKKIVDATPTNLNSEDSKRIKDKFRADIAGVIVHHLGPYRRDDCKIGRISSNDDFKHLAKKLTQYVMQKELKYCGNTVHALEVTDSVKIKSKEFIKKYMSKYDPVYVKPENEPEYKDFIA